MTVAIEAAARLACKRLVARGVPLVEANVMAELAALYVNACMVAHQFRNQGERQPAHEIHAVRPLNDTHSMSTYAEILGRERQDDESSSPSQKSLEAVMLAEPALAAVPARKPAGRAAASIDPWVTRQQANADLDLSPVLKRA